MAGEGNADGSAAAADAFYPGRAPIDAYGNGGFRFAGMSHRGSILCLPSGISAWQVSVFEEITERALGQVLAEAAEVGVLLLGTGMRQQFIAPPLKRALEAAGFGVEPMSTGAAARTYNVLLAENRRVAAALIAVG